MPSSFPNDTIWKAARRGDLERVREFAQREGIPETEDNDDGEQSLLTVACEAGHADVVRFLRERGSISCSRGNATTLYAPHAFAALRNNHLEVLRVLCEFGLNPYAQEYKHGDSLIDRAIQERRISVVRLLLTLEPHIYLDYEDEVTTQEEYETQTYSSAIEVAARGGDVEMVEFLLSADFPLGERSANDYLEKARANVDKFRQWQDKEEEQKRQRLQKSEADTKPEYLWWCLCLLVALCWGIWRLILWLGWGYVLGGVAVLTLICWGLAKR